jgi:hypothetical protein
MLLKSLPSQRAIRRSIWRRLTYVVLAVLWLAQLLDQALYRFGGRTDKAQAAQVSHLLAVRVVQSAGVGSAV